MSNGFSTKKERKERNYAYASVRFASKPFKRFKTEVCVGCAQRFGCLTAGRYKMRGQVRGWSLTSWVYESKKSYHPIWPDNVFGRDWKVQCCQYRKISEKSRN